MAWSPDGSCLATASYDNTARIWDPHTGETTITLTGHTDQLDGVAWSPDGTRLATASNDNTARIWDPHTGETIITLNGHGDRVNAVAWSPDGALLATADKNGTIILWSRDGDESTSIAIQSATSLAWSENKLAVGQHEGRPAIFKLEFGNLT